MQVFEIITDDTLRETRPHGTTAFPFEYYYDEIKKYINEHVQWHWHNEFEFLAVEKGPVDCLIGNERITLAAGEGLFINSGIIHRLESVGEGIVPNALFTGEFIASKDSDIYRKYVAPIISSGYSHIILRQNVDWQSHILDFLNKIYNEARGQSPTRELALHTLVCSLWSEFFLNIHNSLAPRQAESNTLIQSRLQIMLQFIHEHFSHKIALEDIAKAASISKSEALRCFHFGVHTTPVNYLIEYRLDRARQLLLTTRNTITDISLTVGFESVGYFCRKFKKTFGVSPKGFRRSNSI